MKTIAAVALAEEGALSLPQIMAAGIFVSGCVLLLGAMGLMGLATRLIPGAVIRGMQLGLGLGLALKGWQQVWYANAKAPPARSWWGVNGLGLGLCAVAFILLTVYPRPQEEEQQQEEAHTTAPAADVEAPAPVQATAAFVKQLCQLGDHADVACGGRDALAGTHQAVSARTTKLRVPAALLLVVLGVVLVFFYYSPALVHSLRMGPSTPHVILPSAADWATGVLRAGLPQLSLTVFNSVISVCQLSAQLFPERPASPAAVATSVGAMNLVGCWFGAMPACHGVRCLSSGVDLFIYSVQVN